MRYRKQQSVSLRSRAASAVRRRTEGFRGFLGEEKVRRRAVLILAVCALLTAFQAGRGLGNGKKYIVNSSGSVTGLYRENTDRSSSFPLQLEIRGKDVRSRKDLTLTINGKRTEGEVRKESMEEQISREVSRVISGLEESRKKKILLPSSLENGTKLIWRIHRDRSGLLFLLAGPFLIWLMYYDDRKKVQNREKSYREAVMRDLPGFNDQLLMLLNCGMIFSDALLRIAEGYRLRPDRGYFRELIIGIGQEAGAGNQSLVRVFCQRSAAAGIRELSRIAGFVADNQYRGVDLTGKLEMESAALWEKRKMMAEEKGKIAETKMTLPLAILLIALIVITAAPAILQVQGY